MIHVWTKMDFKITGNYTRMNKWNFKLMIIKSKGCHEYTFGARIFASKIFLNFFGELLEKT